MRLHKFFLRLMCVLIIGTCCTGSVLAASSSSNSPINITVNGSDSITIKPGTFPDLGSDIDTIQDAAAEKVVDTGKVVAQTITAICSIICFVALLINIAKLSTSNGMAILRRQALIGLLWSGISLSLFGGAWVVVSFFWNFLR